MLLETESKLIEGDLEVEEGESRNGKAEESRALELVLQ